MMKKRGNLYLLTSLIILSIISIIYAWKGVFPFSDNSVIWGDMHNQITAFYYQLYDAIRGNGSLFINFNTSGSINFWGIMAYYIVSPVSLLILLFERSQIYQVVSLIVAIKFILAGLSMLYFIGYYFKKVPDYLKVILSVLYAFCGYNLIMYQITPWMDIIYLFPFLMIGLKKLLDLENPKLYLIVLTICLICCFYLSFLMLVFIIITSYIYLKCFKDLETRKKAITSLGINTVISLLLSSFMLLPTFIELFKSSRVGFDFINVLNTRFSYTYDKISFFFPTIILFVFIFLLFKKFYKDKKHQSFLKYLSINLILLIIPVIIEPINKMLHLGSYICFPYRYGFIPIFLIIVGCCYYFNNIKLENKKIDLKIVPIIITSLIIIINFYLTFYNLKTLQLQIETLAISNNFKVCLILGIMSILSLINMIIVYNYYKKNIKVLSIFIGIISLSSIITNTYIYVGNDYSMNKLMENYEQMTNLYETKSSNEIFRLKNLYAPLVRNYGMVSGYHSLDHFTSLTEKENMDTLKRLGYSSLWMDTSSEGGTIFTDMLLANKYLLSGEEIDNKYYDYITKFNNLYLYQTNLPLSYGYLLDYNVDIIDEDDAFDSNNNLYQAITGKNQNLIKIYSDFNHQNIRLNIYNDKVHYRIINRKMDAIIEQNIKVNNEGIVYLDILNSLDNSLNTSIRYKMKILVNDEVFKEEYTTKNQNGILNLGIFKDEVVNVKIVLLDNIELSTLEIGVLDTKLLEDFMYENCVDTHVVFDKNKIRLNIYMEAGKVLFLPITYDDGYIALNNGNETEIFKVLDNYIGIRLNYGINDIEISYYPPGLKNGILISISAIILTIILYLFKLHENIINNKFINRFIYDVYLFVFVGVMLIIFIIPFIAFFYGLLGGKI